MYPSSPEFIAQVQSGHQRMRSSIDVLRGGALIESFMLDEASALQIASGEVVADAGNPVRRRGGFVVIDRGGLYTPKQYSDLFSVIAGNEIRISRGLVLPSGVLEMKPLILGPLMTAVTDDGPEGVTVSVEIQDRTRWIRRNKWTATKVIDNNTNVVTAMETIISDRYPGAVFHSSPTSHTTGRLVLEPGSDPWATVMTIAEGAGYEAYPDVDGGFVIAPVPDLVTATPVMSFGENGGARLLKASRKASNEDLPNGVIITGASSYGITPPRGEAWDTDPASPTYYKGAYGMVPEFPSANETILTKAQAGDAAVAWLRRKLGAPESVEFESTVNPALNPGDVFQMTRARIGIDAVFVLDRVPVPLTPQGTMAATTRERRLLVA